MTISPQFSSLIHEIKNPYFKNLIKFFVVSKRLMYLIIFTILFNINFVDQMLTNVTWDVENNVLFPKYSYIRQEINKKNGYRLLTLLGQ